MTIGTLPAAPGASHPPLPQAPEAGAQPTLSRLLIRAGRGLTFRGVEGPLRAGLLALGTVLLALGLGAMAAVPAVHAQRADQQTATSPRYVAGSSARAHLLMSDADYDTIDDLPVAVAAIAPTAAGTLLLPPGVARMPAPGQAVASPRLRVLLEHHATSPYGTVVGTIAATGLGSPEELRVYYRPTRPMAGLHGVSGFGGQNAALLHSTTALYQPSLLQIEFMLAGLLVAPALLVVWVAAGMGSLERRRRAALLRTLGASRSELRALNAAESAPPVVIGLVVLLVLLGVLLVRDVTLPWLDFVVQAAAMRRGLPGILGALAVSLAVVAISALRIHEHSVRNRRPSLPSPASLLPGLAACCATVVWALFGPTGNRMWIFVYMALVLSVIVGLPRLVESGAALLGNGLARHGDRTGRATWVVGGRQLEHHSRRTARLAATLAAAILLFGHAQLWDTALGAQYEGAMHLRNQIGTTVLVTTRPVSAGSVGVHRFVAGLDSGTLTLPLRQNQTTGATTVTAPCTALHAAGISCTAGSHALDHAVEPLQASLGYLSPLHTPRVHVLSAGANPTGKVTLVLVSQSGLDRDAINALAHRTAPGQLAVEIPGTDYVSPGRVLLLQSRWLIALSLLGVLALASAFGTASIAGSRRSAAGIAPLASLFGRRHLHRGVAAITLGLPLTGAVLLGLALYLVLPQGVVQRGGSGMHFSGTFTVGIATLGLILAAVTTVAGTSVSRWAAGRWRPGTPMD